MASSEASVSRTSKEYDDQRTKVSSQLKNNQLQPVDLYFLASLLAAWRTSDTLPVCLLCQTAEAPNDKKFQLGHIIPHSVLKTLKLKYFAHRNQGKESVISNMGYRAFCGECEERFSSQGEQYFNPEFFAPFYKSQDNMITVNVRDKDGNPWMYFFLVSVVWRSLCFASDCQIFIEVLEYLREFLLTYPAVPAKEHDIDSKITFYVFAPNKDIESKCKPENEVYKKYFYKNCTTEFETCVSIVDPENPVLTAMWVFLGPVHVLMRWNIEGSVPLPFGLSEDDLAEAKKSCEFKRTHTEIVIKKKQERFFPMSVFKRIVSWGNNDVGQTSRIPQKDVELDLASPPVQARCLYLLPQFVQFDNGDFKFPAFFTETFRSILPTGDRIVGARRNLPSGDPIVGTSRGANERIIFVCLQQAIPFDEDGETKHGPLAMALEIDANNKIVSYVKDAKIPSAEKFSGLDLTTNIPCKADIQEWFNDLIKKGIPKW